MNSKRRKSRSPGRSWVTYERSYLVTLGLAFIAVTGLIWRKQGDTLSEWPTWACLVFFGLPVLGLVLVLVGFLARREQIEKWADRASRHEASIILMILAFPVFLVMSLFDKRD